MSSQCMFDSGLAVERELDADAWAKTCPRIERMAVSYSGTTFGADLEHYAQSVDQRVKCAAWIDEFA